MPHRRGKSHRIRNVLVAIIVLMVFISVVVVAFQINGGKPANSSSSSSSGNDVLLVTSMGNITIQLYDNKPITTGNFKSLVKTGVYIGTLFHRVISGFMIQGGGNPNYTNFVDPRISPIQDELMNPNKNDIYTVAMANTGQPNTSRSEFFINVVNNSALRPYLDSGYTVFGRVIQGMDVVDNIAKVQTDANDRPVQDVKIIKASLLS